MRVGTEEGEGVENAELGAVRLEEEGQQSRQIELRERVNKRDSRGQQEARVGGARERRRQREEGGR